MGMDWQEIAALSLVAATAGAFALARLRARPKGPGCASHGECFVRRSKEPPPSIIYHSRKGERPTFTIRPG